MKKNVQNLSSEKTGHKPVIREIYDCLLDLRGHQGWWPLTELHETGGTNPTKTGSVKGYHPADYTYPQTRGQQFEIICGALLTQNTSWIQVEKALLNLKQLNAFSPEVGIAPETADSILLYAFKRPFFVVDAYTRRIVTNLGLVDEKADYDEIKALFEESIPHDMKMYQEYHALLVEHAKKYYQKKGSYAKCPLLNIVQD